MLRHRWTAVAIIAVNALGVSDLNSLAISACALRSIQTEVRNALNLSRPFFFNSVLQIGHDSVVYLLPVCGNSVRRKAELPVGGPLPFIQSGHIGAIFG